MFLKIPYFPWDFLARPGPDLLKTGLVHDILLLGTWSWHWAPEGVRCQMVVSMDLLAIHGLGKLCFPWKCYFLDHMASMISLTGRFMPKKPAFWSRIDHYPRFFGHFLTSARAWPSLTLSKTGLKPNLVVGVPLTCHRIDELFKPNWVPRPSQRPRRPPQEF